jgi:serine phosphatase RsbU (regulator of sigma subunit)/anti-sigma regulatory factor (Ser/Thr protein kinase)
MKAPAELPASAVEALLHAAFDASPVPGVLTEGPDHRVVHANDAYLVEFGSCAMRRPATEALPELASAGLVAALDEVYETGHPLLLEDRLVRRRGGDCYYTLLVVPAGTGLSVVCRDMTERVRREQVLLEDESRNRNMAVALQRSLLPQRIVQPDEIRLAACYLPALVRYDYDGVTGDDEPVLEVGGDWYDAIPLGAGRTGLVVGGVAPEAGGVGVRAAAVMGRLRAAVRAYASQNLPPGEVMYHLDRHALEYDGERARTGSAVATLVYAVHDADNGSLTYANAGHLPPLLRLPDGYVAVLDGASGPCLGTGEWTWQEAAVAVPPGSYLAFYTQGLLERGKGDLRRIFGRAPDEEPPRRGAGPVDLVRDHILASIDPLSVSSGNLDPDGRATRTDDVALLVAHAPHWSGPHAALFRSASVELVGGPEIAAHARAFTNGVLASWGVGDQLTDTGVLAVSELVANAVTHGNPPVGLRLRRTDRRVIIDVSDQSDHQPRRRLAREMDEDGRGIGIVAALATSWGSRPLPEGKSVWCEFEF